MNNSATADKALEKALFEFNSKGVLSALKRGANPNNKILTYTSWTSPDHSLKMIGEGLGTDGVCEVSLLTYAINRYMYYPENADIINHLLEFGADPNGKNDVNFGQLDSPYYAVMYSRDYPWSDGYSQMEFDFLRTGILLKLLKHGANPIQLNSIGETVMHVTAYSMNIGRTEWLASIDEFSQYFDEMLHIRDNNGVTPIGRAAYMTTSIDNSDILFEFYSALIRRGADINSPLSTKDPRTLEKVFMGANKIDIWKRLLALGASMNNNSAGNIAPRVRL